MSTETKKEAGMRSEFDEPVDPYRSGANEPDTTPLRDMETFHAWDYRPDVGWSPQFELTGYRVEAVDGSVGKVSQATHAMNGSFLAVDTGTWIFGRTVIIPAGIVANIHHPSRTVYLDRTKDEVKSAPDYSDEQAYWDKLADYYRTRY